jgi:hypothetical protein
MATPTALGQLPGNRSSTSLDPLLQECRDAYKISEEAYRDSITEGKEVIDLYHNRQYTEKQLKKLVEEGRPAETYNIIKMMANAMIGYMDTQVTEVNVEPRYMSSSTTALLLNDIVKFTLEQNDFETMNKKLKLDGLLTGLMVCYEEVVPTGRKDKYGRDLNEIKLSHIPSWQCRIDPMSSLDDYSDAKFLNTFKWLRAEEIVELFGQSKLDKLTEYYNFLDGDPQADYAREYKAGREEGRYRQHDSYLVVKTIIRYKKKIWSVIWNDEFILEKKEVSFNKVRFPYRVTKMSNSDISEYYGPFRDITETQHAINQAILQVQLLVNTSKAFVEDNAVDDVEEFRELFNRVNAVIPVQDLQGIRVEDMSRDIAAQYGIIDQALERVKKVLGINDSFLGSSFASDSGRKVAMQTQSSASQLTMVVDKVQYMFKMIGTDIVALAKQFYQAEQIFRIADPLNSEHYAHINKPIEMPTGQITEQGDLVTSIIWTEDTQDDGTPKQDTDGAYLMTPLTEVDSTIRFSEVDIKIVATNGQNADERNQLLMETFINGPAGQILMQTNPAAYLRTLAMQVSEFGTKHSLEIARLLMETAMGIEQGSIDPRLAMVGGDLQAIMGSAMGGNQGAGGQPGGTMPSQGSTAPQGGPQGPKSPTLGLPKPGGQ